MAKLIDLNGLDHFWDKVKAWVSDNFLSKSDAPEGSTPYDGNPQMDGTASAGSSNAFARGDHRHPSDTNKQDTIDDIDAIRRGAYLGATALQSFSENDPTVPSWAKQPNKPSYKYSEIGDTPDLGGFVTKSVNDLTNYYLKSETYTKAEVAALIAAIQQFHYEIYATLPQTGESNVLYLIGPTGAGSDRYEEYVYASNVFVKIGDTSIDLSGYVTASALDAALSAYTTTSDLTTLLSSKQDKIDSSHKLDYSLIANTPTIPTVPTISTDIASDASDNTKTASPKAVKDYVDAHGGSGGEENVIETVKVNGTALTPDSDKAVDIIVPTTLASLSDDSTHRTVSDTEKSTWSGKSDFSGSYNDLTNTPLEDLIVTFTLNAPDLSHGTTDYTTSQIATEAARGRKVYLKQSGVDTLIPAKYIDSQEVDYCLLEGYLTNDGLGGIIPESYISIYVQEDDAITINSEQFNRVAFDGESDPVFTASPAHGITSSDITNWNSKGTYSKPSGGIPDSDIASASTWNGKYTKPSSGIPASDLASGVIPDISGKADKTLVASSMPSGGFLPNTVYNLGTLIGNTTFSMAAATDNTIANIWCWTFTTSSTAPTITWPAAITGWSGGSQPTINASKSYEVTVMNGLAIIIES